MNAAIHAKLSSRYAGTENQKDWDFFYKIHDFMDCSKEVEPSNKHRILTHHMWFVKNVTIPLFGHTYVCETGRKVNIKDDMESNHILADFAGKFIPTLDDYFDLVDDDESDKERFEQFYLDNKHFFSGKFKELMMSPFAITGKLKSLWLTHNIWFINHILPKIFPEINFEPTFKNQDNFSPKLMFDRMKSAPWIQNGLGFPARLEKIRAKKQIYEPKTN